MNITPEQAQEIATRLGLTEPLAPKAVADYLELWATHEKTVNDYDRPRLSGYYYRAEKFETLEGNLNAVNAGIEALETLKAQMEHLSRHKGEIVALATHSYENELRTYWQAINTEAERPRKEFETAKDAFVFGLSKERTNLKSRITRATNRLYDNPTDGDKAQAKLEIAQMRDRLEVADWLLTEASGVYYDKDTTPEFTEEAIFARAASNAYYYEGVFTRFQNALTEDTKAVA